MLSLKNAKNVNMKTTDNVSIWTRVSPNFANTQCILFAIAICFIWKTRTHRLLSWITRNLLNHARKQTKCIRRVCVRWPKIVTQLRRPVWLCHCRNVASCEPLTWSTTNSHSQSLKTIKFSTVWRDPEMDWQTEHRVLIKNLLSARMFVPTIIKDCRSKAIQGRRVAKICWVWRQ